MQRCAPARFLWVSQAVRCLPFLCSTKSGVPRKTLGSRAARAPAICAGGTSWEATACGGGSTGRSGIERRSLGAPKSRTRPCLRNSESYRVAAVWCHADPQHAEVRLEVAGGAGSGALHIVRAGADCRLGAFWIARWHRGHVLLERCARTLARRPITRMSCNPLISLKPCAGNG